MIFDSPWSGWTRVNQVRDRNAARDKQQHPSFTAWSHRISPTCSHTQLNDIIHWAAFIHRKTGGKLGKSGWSEQTDRQTVRLLLHAVCECDSHTHTHTHTHAHTSSYLSLVDSCCRSRVCSCFVAAAGATAAAAACCVVKQRRLLVMNRTADKGPWSVCSVHLCTLHRNKRQRPYIEFGFARGRCFSTFLNF